MQCRVKKLCALMLASFGCAIGGCNSTDEAAPDATADAVASSGDAKPADDGTDRPTASTSPAAPTATGSNAEEETKPPDAAGDKSVAQFTPPFPDRLELFEAPKRAQGAVRQSDNEGQTVELKGFITVDQPRAVLSIDGVISPIPVGGEKYGVQVLSIQPPSAVLQRGRNRWTATLD